jgi:prolyl oligopeptidase
MATVAAFEGMSAELPRARVGDVVETLHGVEVADPYRWMEEIDSDETRAWVEAQQAYTEAWMEGLPDRKAIEERLTEAFDYDKHGVPELIGGRLFYSRKTGLQNQSVHYWREDVAGAEEKVLLDPNTLSEDGTVSVAGWSVSDDGKLVAYGLSESGSDWTTWHVMEVDSGRVLDDEIRWVKFSWASWVPDSSGFYYSRYDAPEEGEELKDTNLNQKAYFHRIGTPQSEDRLVYARPDHPKWGFGVGVTEDERFQVISVWEGAGSKNGFFYRDLKAGADSPVEELFPDFDARYRLVGNDDAVFFFVTDRDAPRKKLVAVNLEKPGVEHWETILPEGKGTLQSVSYLSGRFIAQTLVDAHDVVTVHDREGTKLGEVKLPNLASAGGFGGYEKDTETFYIATSYTSPGVICRYDVLTGESRLFWEPEFPVDLSPYETVQVRARSKDGTEVPMFVTRRKDAPMDGSVPTLLYGYGGFNISLTPGFSTSTAVWLELGGAYVVANLRGGGEYGEDWHQAGMQDRKQNVFDDFIAAAEFLIEEKYTSREHLVIYGGSNGGLLVGACVNQRPDLYAGASSAVGVHDMLRFHKFTIGWAWQEEYGDVGDEAAFKVLRSYSPYHNIEEGGDYPPVLIETADHDDRVFPAHSFKYGARLQAAQGGEAPILMRIETKAGHGAGTPTEKIIEATADRFAFFMKFAK